MHLLEGVSVPPVSKRVTDVGAPWVEHWVAGCDSQGFVELMHLLVVRSARAGHLVEGPLVQIRLLFTWLCLLMLHSIICLLELLDHELTIDGVISPAIGSLSDSSVHIYYDRLLQVILELLISVIKKAAGVIAAIVA